MGKQTHGLTKNQIRRSLLELVDPSPTDLELLEWEGEMETILRLEEKLSSIKDIMFEYK